MTGLHNDYEEVDDDLVHPRVLKNGAIYVPLVAMDAVQREIFLEGLREFPQRTRIVDARGRPAGHGKGFCIDTDPQAAEAREEAYRERDAEISNFWRQGQQATEIAIDGESLEDAYEARDRWLTSAWKASV